MSVLFGAEVGSIEPGRAEIQLKVRSEMLKSHGPVQEITGSAVADSAAGYAT